MLFLTALAHGVVILGVTFSSGIGESPPSSTTLKVTLVTGADARAPEEAEFIANQNRQGSGADAEAQRPTAAISTEALMNIAGDPRGADLRDAVQREAPAAAAQLLTSGPSDRTVNAAPNAAEDVAAQPERAADMLNVRANPSHAAEIDLIAQTPNSADADAQTGPSARESILAAYLNAWRARVERVGTLNFPRAFLANHAATRRPRLEVAIGPDGRLRDIVVQRSSGDRAVDQAAVNILRMAAPFDPLPQAVRDEYDVLRFAYEWDFIQSGP
jgi:protein TonB